MEQFIQKIALRGVKCNAGHGWYPEEQMTGNSFSVDLEASFNKRETNELLERALNYEDMNDIILNSMKTAKKLLETVAEEIIHELIRRFPFIDRAEVVITKHQPAMRGNVGSSVVTLNYIK